MPFPGITNADLVYTPTKSAVNKSIREYYETAYSNDPFNKPPNDDGAFWAYIENRIVISGASNIRYVNMQTLTLPTVEQAFSADTYGNSSAPASRVFSNHYQKQIVQIAVKRMTQTDIGLMTPPQ